MDTPSLSVLPALPAPLAQALADKGYTDLTAVQAAVLDPQSLSRDLLVSAQTGSGKTVAYGLSMAASLLGEAEILPPAGLPLALVVAPTRELALQVHAELSWLYQPAGGVVVSCVGGMDPRAEQRRLSFGAHVVVGTPGRLRDHLERGALRPAAMKVVVLDEADEMLDLGFREDLEFILDATPGERRTLLFSATLPREITAMARQYQRDVWRIALEAGPAGHADIEYRVMRVSPTEIEHAVVNLLRFVDAPTAMVFCATREAVRHLQASLLERGFGVVALSGELSQNERNHALQALRDGRARVCVATDVAARGIDLPSLDLVIHAELPRTAETLHHRSGRTGRAGRKGVSVLLVPLSRRRRAEYLLAEAGIEVPWTRVPTAEDIRALDQDRLLAHPVLGEELSEDEVEMARALLAQRSAEALAAALVRMYRSQLPAAEDVFDPGPLPPRAQRPDAPAWKRERDAGDRPSYQRDGGDRHQRDGADRPARDSADRPVRDSADRGEGPERFKRDHGPAVWFRLDIGREKNADPRWLIPLICRQGRISKTEIGVIRILERETRFEIAASVAERFQAALQQVERPEGRIDLLGDTPPQDEPREAFRKPRPPRDRERPAEGRAPFPPKRKTESWDRPQATAEGHPHRPEPARGPAPGKGTGYVKAGGPKGAAGPAKGKAPSANAWGKSTWKAKLGGKLKSKRP